MIYSVDVTIGAPVQGTEVADRVEEAVTNLFPDAEFRREPDRFVAESHSLDAFSDVLHEQEILDTARRQFFGGVEDDGFAFSLKKQPAFEDVVTFAVGNPSELGDIHVRVRVNEPDVESYIDQVAPPTQDGKPVQSDEY